MRKYLTAAMAIALMSGVSYADLQNVEIGGEVRIRGNSYWDVYSHVRDDHNNDDDNLNGEQEHNQFTEQRSVFSVDADFSEDVSARIAFSNYKIWGDTWNQFNEGTELDDDNSGPRGNTVSLNEAYIKLGDAIAGFDLTIGRQEVELGSEFLVGNENTSSNFIHRAFDGIRADYAGDNYTVTLFDFKAWETDYDESSKNDDADFRGIYVSYTGIENHTIDGYVLQYHEGEDDEKKDQLTIGARAAGTFGNFDYELEVATQTGDVENVPGGDLDYEGDAINAELGYTFDSNMQPRVFLGYASFSGTDESDEIGFQRLYSDWEYSEFLGDGNMSNVTILRAGVSANVSEKIGLGLTVASFELDEEGMSTYNSLAYVTGDDDDLGTEVGVYMTYQYSEDVAIEVGAAQLMFGDAIEDANVDEDDDPLYVYAEISLSF